ncbi:general secretion pathway protein G [Salipiger aestuarii]|uniref:Type II secretion system core protein G n=1 Tax=Salipiger aestuarii TaxID=568098 RepID=A0A327XWT7_9RHOB|nr:type II secretion system major pseudopilin GspG [Salipiger aestuarii]RAK13200.1 general secretion pathway protein G [Salipiger aestuarii]
MNCQFRTSRRDAGQCLSDDSVAARRAGDACPRARRSAVAFPGTRRSADDGFSLLELMVVVVILSLLAVVIVPRVIDRPDQARVARARADIAAITSAVNLYRLDNFRYPTTEQGLSALVSPPATDPVPANWASNGYMDRMPVDPWGQPYQYLAPGVHGDFDIFSYGADAVSGGSGTDADIGSWAIQ